MSRCGILPADAKMLVHQLAVADKAFFESGAFEKARLLNLAGMMETFQKGLLTLLGLRTGWNQTIVVQRMSVTEGAH